MQFHLHDFLIFPFEFLVFVSKITSEVLVETLKNLISSASFNNNLILGISFWTKIVAALDCNKISSILDKPLFKRFNNMGFNSALSDISFIVIKDLNLILKILFDL